MVFWIATAIFIISYGLIVSGKVDKTKVAFIGAGLMLALKIVSQHEAFYDVKYATDITLYFCHSRQRNHRVDSRSRHAVYCR